MCARRSSAVVIAACVAGIWLGSATNAAAQAGVPPPPEPEVVEEPELKLPDIQPVKTWRGSLSGGLALTSGNTDTSTINASYEIVRDAKKRLVFKSTGLYIRGQKEADLTVDRTTADARLDYRLTQRVFTFGQVSYLRDRFRKVEFLLAPTVGVGASLVDTEASKLVVDTSFGTAVEGTTAANTRASPAIAFGQRLFQQITESTRITQVATALWKVDDFGDVLYTFSAGIATSITTRSELKAEVLDSFKNAPATPLLQRNDVAVLMSVVYKF
jgi:putative salt-induced outer membrane protein YdiY